MSIIRFLSISKGFFIFLAFVSFFRLAKAQLTYDSSAVIQITDSLFMGQQDAKILQLVVYASGSSSDSSKISNIIFSTNGTGNSSDILRAELHFLDSNSSKNKALDVATLLQIINYPKGSNTFTDSVYIKTGVNYFLLAYDLSHQIEPKDSFDGEINFFDFDGVSKTPSIAAPVGNRITSTMGSRTYCLNSRSFSGSYQIGPTRVTIGSIRSIYSDNTDFYKLHEKTIDVKQGQKIPLSIETGPFYDEVHHVWIDWDGDGYFESDEKVLTSNTILAGGESSVNLKVPCGISAPGLRRMRIIGEFYSSNITGSCAPISYGSVEDYVFNVLPETQPLASFLIDSNAYKGGTAFLKNTTNNTALNIKYEWDIDNDSIFDTSAVDLNFRVGTGAKQTVVLKAEMKSCDNNNRFFSTYKADIQLKSIASAPSAEFIANKNLVTPGELVQFTDLTENGVSKWKWSIVPAKINGETTIEFVSGTSKNSKNPLIKFVKQGKYAVLLEVTNAKGEDKIAKLNYVTVQSDYELCKTTSSGDTLSNRVGVITDNGGRKGVYANNLNCSVLIKPKCAEEVHLDLNLIDISKWTEIGNNGDFLRVYDGYSSNDSALHKNLGFKNGIFTKGNAPISLGRLTAKSGAMFVAFSSDASTYGDGFELQYSITPKKVQKPKAKIIGIDTTYINTPETFTADNRANWIDKIWDFNGDGLPEAFGNVVSKRFTSFGTFDVSVVLDACGNTDTAYKKVVVLAPGKAPIADFKTDFTIIDPSDTLRIIDQSKFGPTEFSWRIDRASAVHFVNNTNFKSRYPQLVFDSLGFYTISLWVKNGMGEDSILKLNYIQVRDYCIPSVVSDIGKLGITKVFITNTMGDTLVNNKTARKSGYSNYAGRKKFTASQGEAFIIRIERGDTSYSMQRAVWLDKNLDGEFSKTEKILAEKSAKSKYFVDTFLIDTNVNLGFTRLRIGVNTAGRTDYGCGPHLSGEFEDYGIIVVPDRIGPEITLLGGDTIGIEMCATFVDPGYLAIDNVNGNISSKVDTSGSVNSLLTGNYQIRYSVQDVAGNATEVIRYVVVGLDSTAPQISLKGNFIDSVEVFSSYKDSGFLAYDFCSGLNSTKVFSSIDTTTTGEYFVLYRAYDKAGNRDSIKRIVRVVDTQTPLFHFKNNSDTLYIDIGTKYLDTGWVITDNYDTTFKITVIGEVNTLILDTFSLQYEIFDLSGNGPVKARRTVIVLDRTAPRVELPFDSFIVEVGRKVNLPEPWVSDNYDFSPALYMQGSFDKDVLGDYEIRYFAKDKSKNVSDTAKLIVHVVDLIAPKIAIKGAPFVTQCRWENLSELGFTASDNYNELEEIKLETKYLNRFDVEVIAKDLVQSNGYYTAVYTAADESGNMSYAYRTILVEECGPNVISEAQVIGVHIFPNPVKTNHRITIRSKYSKIEYVELINAQGQIIQSFYPEGESIFLNEFKPGVYLLRVVTNNSSTIETLIVTE